MKRTILTKCLIVYFKNSFKLERRKKLSIKCEYDFIIKGSIRKQKVHVLFVYNLPAF